MSFVSQGWAFIQSLLGTRTGCQLRLEFQSEKGESLSGRRARSQDGDVFLFFWFLDFETQPLISVNCLSIKLSKLFFFLCVGKR